MTGWDLFVFAATAFACGMLAGAALMTIVAIKINRRGEDR